MDIAAFNKEDLAKLVFTDELTSLYNRRFFYQYLKDQVKWDDPAQTFSLLMMDIDFFKKINDTYGHLEGDNVLCQLGAILKEAVGDQGLAVRYAGDEFSAILPGAGKDHSRQLAEKMLAAVSGKKFRKRDEKAPGLSINISIGIAAFPEDAATSHDLIEQADKALYLSKRQGRNRVSLAGSFSDGDMLERDIFLKFPCPDFIARQDYYHEISRLLAPNRDAHAFVLIEGPVGAGKSRLLRELSLHKEALAFYSSCEETDSLVPYRPIVEFITSLAESKNPVLAEACMELPGEMLVEISRIAPKINELAAPNVPTATAEQNRKLLFDSLVKILNLMSQKKPLLLIMDEAQNIDHATLLVTEALTEQEQGCSVIVAAIRDDYLNAAEPANEIFHQFISTISERPNYRRFSLPLLNQEQTAAIVAAIFGRQFNNPGFHEQLYRTTGGNPLFIEELLKHLLLKKLFKQSDRQWTLDLPAIPAEIWNKTLDSVIAENIDLLESETKAIIKQATVVGQNVPLDVLKDVAHQNEGETIDALDKAKKLNIIKSVDPMKHDKFTFTTKHFQEIVYQNIEEKEREILHQAVGDATERLYQDKLDSVAPALAFHFSRSGDEAKAQIYGQKAENITANLFRKDEATEYYSSSQGIVNSKIKESIQPLSPPKMSLIKDLLRNIISTNKNMRLYPDGSTLIVMASGGLIKIMNSIFEESESFTLSEAKDALNINAVPLDPKIYGAATEEFLASLKEHYIKSITFRLGVSEQEIERLLKNLDKSPDKPFSAKGYWNQFLESAGIANIGIAQRSFVAARGKDAAAALPGVQQKIELDGPIVAALKDFFRFFCAAVDNIKLYPPGSQMAKEAVKFVIQSAEKVFAHLTALNLSVSDDILLINGTPGHPRILGTASTILAKLIREYQLKSISFIRGASGEEIELFISMLSGMSPEEAKEKSLRDWNNLLAEKGINSIKIGIMVYTAAETSRQSRAPAVAPQLPPHGSSEAKTPKTEPAKNLKPAVKRDESLSARLSNIMKGLPDHLLEGESLKIAEEFLQNNDEENFNLFLQKFMQNFRSNRQENRLNAQMAYQRLLKKAPDGIKVSITAKTEPVISAELSLEKTPAVYNAILNTAALHAVYYLESKNYAGLKTIIQSAAKDNPGQKSLESSQSKTAPADSGIKMQGDNIYKMYASLKQSEGFPGFIQSLVNSSQAERNVVREIFACFQLVAAQDLIDLIKETENSESREFVANIINQMGPQAYSLFANELNLQSEASVVKKLLSVAHLMPVDDLEQILAEFIKEPFYEEALNGLSKLNPDKSSGALLPFLKEKNNGLVLSVMSILGTLPYNNQASKDQASAAIISILESSSVAELQKEAVKTLVKMQDPKAVPALIKLLLAKRFLGFVGGVSDEMRGTAVWALGQIKTPESLEALSAAVNDKSPQVRSIAKLSLKNYE